MGRTFYAVGVRYDALLVAISIADIAMISIIGMVMLGVVVKHVIKCSV